MQNWVPSGTPKLAQPEKRWSLQVDYDPTIIEIGSIWQNRTRLYVYGSERRRHQYFLSNQIQNAPDIAEYVRGSQRLILIDMERWNQEQDGCIMWTFHLLCPAPVSHTAAFTVYGDDEHCYDDFVKLFRRRDTD